MGEKNQVQEQCGKLLKKLGYEKKGDLCAGCYVINEVVLSEDDTKKLEKLKNWFYTAVNIVAYIYHGDELIKGDKTLIKEPFGEPRERRERRERKEPTFTLGMATEITRKILQVENASKNIKKDSQRINRILGILDAMYKQSSECGSISELFLFEKGYKVTCKIDGSDETVTLTKENGKKLYDCLNIFCEIQTGDKIEKALAEAPQPPSEEDIEEILKTSHQIILQGPPGTGKTHIAKSVAGKLSGDKNRIRLLQFHPSYGYEDFVIGLEAKSESDSISYEAKSHGIKEFADKARGKEENYVLIIDEINRAPLNSVMGELLYALENREDDNEVGVTLPYKDENGNNKFLIPNNLYIIGTMNTADQTIHQIDYALRRRFAFVSIPSCKIDVSEGSFDGDLYDKIMLFFENTESGMPPIKAGIDPEDIKPGGSYFIKKDDEHIKYKIQYEIVPLLVEYYKDAIFHDNVKIKIADKEWTIKEWLNNNGKNLCENLLKDYSSEEKK